MRVKPKKRLGQHFLKDTPVMLRIVNALSFSPDYHTILEIGPGTGALTQFLIQKQTHEFYAIEVDTALVTYLKTNYPSLQDRIITADFLNLALKDHWSGPIAVIGNFPYNISSQIFFKLLEARDQVQEIVCMVQKEVAERIVAQPGSKIYGTPSVYLQAFYAVEYLFTVGPALFNPPPKVDSAVIRLKRNAQKQLPCREDVFFQIIKLGFQQRRKKLRNALKSFHLPIHNLMPTLLDKRAEQLSVHDFITITQQLTT